MPVVRLFVAEMQWLYLCAAPDYTRYRQLYTYIPAEHITDVSQDIRIMVFQMIYPVLIIYVLPVPAVHIQILAVALDLRLGMIYQIVRWIIQAVNVQRVKDI